jgi:hypothetical protein
VSNSRRATSAELSTAHAVRRIKNFALTRGIWSFFSKKFGGKILCCFPLRQQLLGQLNLPLGALSSRSALPVLVGTLFKKFGFFLIGCVYQYQNIKRPYVVLCALL